MSHATPALPAMRAARKSPVRRTPALCSPGLPSWWTGRYTRSADTRASSPAARAGQAVALATAHNREYQTQREALYLKAQILWEGFGNYEQTMNYLDKVLQLVDEQEGLYRWASTYYDEVQNSSRLEE